MYFVIGTRQEMLKSIPRQQKLCELGVFRGDNAQFMLEHIRPEELHLVDSWSAEVLTKSYYITDTKLPFVTDLEAHAEYFGGNPTEQPTWDAAYKIVCDRFADKKNVKILRKETHLAAADYPDEYFDMIYVDASHQYPFVQRDLFCWENKLKKDGLMVLNDCAHSPAGRAQNLGVLEAVINFVKSTTFKPLALTCDSFADLVLTRTPHSVQAQAFQKSLLLNKATFVIELPDEMLFNFNYKILSSESGFALHLPSFKL